MEESKRTPIGMKLAGGADLAGSIDSESESESKSEGWEVQSELAGSSEEGTICSISHGVCICASRRR